MTVKPDVVKPSTVKPYAALALQVTCKSINMLPTVESAREQMLASIKHCGQLIAGSKNFIATFSGDECRLVVLPEYFMTSFPMGEPADVWQKKACIHPDGPEYKALGDIAKKQKVYLSGNAYELDDNFPELYFQTSFIIDDHGEVILRYRRLISMYSPTPHDVLDKYLQIYGQDALFPVIDTELGRLACVASEEILYPEITRALALKGAEVICHSSSEVGSPHATPKNIAKQARAYENMLYVVSANSAGIVDLPFPAASTDGGSQVVDYKGKVLAKTDTGESMVGFHSVDINALRRTRSKPAMTNMLARQRVDLFENVYQQKLAYPANNLMQDGQVQKPSREHFKRIQEQAIKSLEKNWNA